MQIQEAQMDMELYTMSSKELLRLDYIKKLIERRITQVDVAERLNMSIRQIQRLVKAYKANNHEGLISKKRGKSGNRFIPLDIKAKIVDIIIKHYSDFGPTLAAEKLRECHDYNISVETLRKWMMEYHLWIPRKEKLKRAYQPRYRRNCFGEMVQIDGSLHHWFEDRGPKCTLLVYIDDATSSLMHLHFVASESMQTYFLATKIYINKHGRPLAFYSDKLSVFRNNGYVSEANAMKATHFGEALKELDIQLICANSPQAKGRVERANKTLQDRLVKELRLQNISTIPLANQYLEEFTQDYNNRFAKPPISKENKHRPVSDHMNLDNILCYKTMRTISNSLTFQHNRQLYLLEDTIETRALRRKQILFCEYPEGHIKVFYNNKELSYRMVYDRVEHLPQGTIVPDNKFLTDILEYAKKRAEELKPIRRSTCAPRRNHLKYLT